MFQALQLDTRKKRRFAGLRALFVFAILAFASNPAFADIPASTGSNSAKAIFATNDLAKPVADALALKAQQPERRVLFVFDVDNTLLRMPQRLGDDTWYYYHAGKLRNGNHSTFRDFAALLDAQAILFNISQMVPTQQDNAALVDQLKQAGIDIFLLTARSPNMFDATKRELERNSIGYAAPYVCVFYLCSGSGEYSDGEIRAALSAIGEPVDDKPFRPILIRDGLMMVAGQNKGQMLDLLLGGIGGERYDHVFFVDDAAHNVQAVAAHDFPLPVAIYHYTRWNSQMTDKEAAETERDLKALRKAVCNSMTSSLC